MSQQQQNHQMDELSVPLVVDDDGRGKEKMMAPRRQETLRVFKKSDDPEFENYSQVAEYYDATRVPVGIQALIRWFQPNDRVLDAGCGTGNYIVSLSPYVGQVVGLEQNQGMIKKAADKIKKKGMNSVVFKGSLNQELPHETESFSGVMMNQVIHHLDTYQPKRRQYGRPVDVDYLPGERNYPNLYRLLGELRRILKPNGILAINLCTREQADGFWWQFLVPPELKKSYRNRHISIQELADYMKDHDFELEESVPIFEPLQGIHYYNPMGPTDETWRRGDSLWSQLSPTELEKITEMLRQRESEGTVGELFDTLDRKRREIGQSTYLILRKVDKGNLSSARRKVPSPPSKTKKTTSSNGGGSSGDATSSSKSVEKVLSQTLKLRKFDELMIIDESMSDNGILSDREPRSDSDDEDF